MVVFWEGLAFICLFVWQKYILNQTLTPENFLSGKYLWKYTLSPLLSVCSPLALCAGSWRNLSRSFLPWCVFWRGGRQSLPWFQGAACPWSRAHVVMNPVQVISDLGVYTWDVFLPTANTPTDDANQSHVVALHTHQGASRVTLQKREQVSCL